MIRAGNFREAVVSGLMLSPFLVLFGVFLAYPVASSLALSLRKVTLHTDWYDVFAQMSWCGLENYRRLLVDVEFWWSLCSTLLYSVLTIPSGIALSLLLALLLSNRVAAVSVFRSAFFLPNVLDPLVVGVVWTLLYAPQYGVVEVVLGGGARAVGLIAGGQHLTGDGLLASPVTVMPAIAIAMVLKGAGFGMILFLTAIQNIPAELYEAASIDGAGPVERFLHVTLPMVRPVILFLSITGVMASLNAFTEVYAMTGGEGGPAMTIGGQSVRAAALSGFYLYKTFERGDYGYAAAVAFTLMLVGLAISLIQVRLVGRGEG